KARLLPATVANKERVRARLAQVAANGSTNHLAALRAGLALRPEIVFFLTDAKEGMMSARDVPPLVAEAGSIRIQVIEFGTGPDSGEKSYLQSLASRTEGSYRYIDVTTFPRELPRTEARGQRPE